MSDDKSPDDWTLEVLLFNVTTGEKKTVVPEGDEAGAIIMKLATIEARFVLDGVQYYSGKPTVDPIRKKLLYWCEGYPQ